MNKGQIFSIDFLIAMILMVFFLGLILSLGEIQSYEKKELGIISRLSDGANAAAIVLTNSAEFACETDTNSFLAFSLDSTKINSITLEELKEKTGLIDYNVSLALDSVVFNDKNDLHLGKQINVINLNILSCEDGLTFQDVNACIAGSCTGTTNKKVLILKVSR